jgi:hypothetical protein
MSENGFGVDTAVLGAYGSTAAGLAGEVGEVGTRTLSGMDALGAESFSALGAQVGLTAAFQRAARAQLDGVAAAASGLGGLGRAVTSAGADYTARDESSRDALRRSRA